MKLTGVFSKECWFSGNGNYNNEILLVSYKTSLHINLNTCLKYIWKYKFQIYLKYKI